MAKAVIEGVALDWSLAIFQREESQWNSPRLNYSGAPGGIAAHSLAETRMATIARAGVFILTSRTRRGRFWLQYPSISRSDIRRLRLREASEARPTPLQYSLLSGPPRVYHLLGRVSGRR